VGGEAKPATTIREEDYVSVQEKEVNGVVVLSVQERVVGGPEMGALHESIHKHLEQKKKYFVVDLSEVERINSSGLGLLIGGLTTARNHGGDLKLVGVSEAVQHILHITRLAGVFEIFPTVEAAIQSFA